MVHIIARFRVKPAHRDEFDETLAANIPQTNAEEGCVRFDAYVDSGDETVVWLVEVWRSDAALAWHYEQAYAQAILDRVDDWLHEPPTVVRCVPFASPEGAGSAPSPQRQPVQAVRRNP